MNKSYPRTEEHKKRISESIIKWHQKIKGTEKEKNMILKRLLKVKGRKSSSNTIEAIKKAHLGKHLSEETKEKIRQSHLKLDLTGSKSFHWKGGKKLPSQMVREHKNFKLWRKAIFQRDNYNCLRCGQHGRKLNAHHIKPIGNYPELALRIANGMTLCENCHKQTYNYLEYRGKNKLQILIKEGKLEDILNKGLDYTNSIV